VGVKLAQKRGKAQENGSQRHPQTINCNNITKKAETLSFGSTRVKFSRVNFSALNLFFLFNHQVSEEINQAT